MKFIFTGFFLVFFFPAFANDTTLTLINGRVADLKDFPASVWTQGCSATVVGPEVVFIAAHCITRNNQIAFTVGPNRHTATCSYAKEYSGNQTADYALCVTNQEITGIPYEKLNTVTNRFSVGDKLLLTGYGCLVLNGKKGGNDGIYRIGESTVERLPREPDNDIRTRGGSALCPGDSGGPAFYIDSQTGDRYVTSTNSRVDDSLRSYLSSTFTSQAISFFNRWSEKTGKKICGLHNDVVGCRGSTQPPLSSTFTVNHRFVNIEGKLTPGNESRLDEIKQLVTESLLWLQP